MCEAKVKMFICFLIIVLGGFSLPLNALSKEVDACSNKRIAEILSQLSVYSLEFTTAGEYSLESVCPGKTIVVTKDRFGVIDHIGVKLFDRQVMRENPSPVYLFVERYLLWVLLTKDNNAIRDRLNEEKVRFKFESSEGGDICRNLKLCLALIRPEQSMIITTDNSKYSVSWVKDRSNVLSVSFPIQYELIWGINKKEAEGQFYDELQNFKPDNSKSSTLIPASMIMINDSCYRSDGDFYGLEQITSYQYYRKKPDGTYVLIFDKFNPAESATNLFTAKVTQSVRTDITQRLYGGRKEVYSVSLAHLKDYCNSNGCEVYVGVEKQEANHIFGSVMMVNRSLGYNHILYFDVDLRTFSYPDRFPVKIQLYSYVPMHNVGNLFDDKK